MNKLKTKDEYLKQIKEMIYEKSSVAKVAKKTGKSRTSIYKALDKDHDPKFWNIQEMAQAMGYTFQLKRIEEKKETDE